MKKVIESYRNFRISLKIIQKDESQRKFRNMKKDIENYRNEDNEEITHNTRIIKVIENHRT